MIRVKSINSNKALNKFIDFPSLLYETNANYVPPLFIHQKRLFNKQKNPFLSHSPIHCIMAFKNETLCGRLAAIKYNYEDYYSKHKTAYFGFYDVINDIEVSNKLFDYLIQNYIDNDCKRLIGPVNPTTNDLCTLLTSGYDSKPIVGMPYNYNYYKDFLKSYGFETRDNLYAFSLTAKAIKDRLGTLSRLLSKKLQTRNIHFQKLNFKSPLQDLKKLYQVYHASNSENPIFMPMSWEEFYNMAMDIKSITSDNHIIIATRGENIIGYIVAIPNINEILIKLKHGKLFPFGFLHLILKRKIKSARIMILGVVEEYRNIGIDICLYHKITENIGREGIFGGEAAYVHEKNNNLIQILKKIGGVANKKYELLELKLN